jgi:transposase-like protein
MNTSQSSATAQWQKIIRRQSASGLSVAQFCQRHGVAPSSFFAWKRRLRSPDTIHRFVEAKIAPSPDAVAGRGAIEIRLRGRRILRVLHGFDPQLLIQVIRTLEGLP